MNRPTIWNLVKVAIAIGLVFLVVSQTSLGEIVAVWRRVSVPWLFIGCLMFFGITWMNARRYWILIERQVGFTQVFGVVILQTAISNLIATSAGAVSYVAMLRGAHQVASGRGITSLLLARVGDLFGMWLGLALASWIVWERITSLHWLILIFLAGIAGGLVAFLLAVTWRYQFLDATKRLLRILCLSEVPIITRGLALLGTLADQRSRTLFPLLVSNLTYSCAIFLLNALWIYFIVQAFAVPIDIWAVVFMGSVTQLLAIVPIQVLGGLGVSDVTSMYLYGIFGISQPEIAPFVVGSRVVFYGINLLLLLLYLPLNSHFRRASANG